MAIVDIPTFVKSIRGRLGDVVYRTSKNGKTYTWLSALMPSILDKAFKGEL